MELKTAIELVKKSHPYAIKYKGVKEDEALQTLLSLAQLFLSVKESSPQKKDFEGYLMEEHAKKYPGAKDCMINNFNSWVSYLGVDEMIEYADKFNNLCHDEFTAWLGGRMEGVEETIREFRNKHPHNEIWFDDLSLNGLARAIKTMILGKGGLQ